MSTSCERKYSISSRESSWGSLTKVQVLEGRPPRLGRRCYEAFGQRDAPCPGCPARSPALAQGPSVSVLPGEDGAFRIVSARRQGDAIEVVMRCLEPAEVSALIAAKLERATTRAQLSAREQAVLGLLLLGRRFEDIARALGIAARTVKFHQSNILRKLGADSRLDLIRLLL